MDEKAKRNCPVCDTEIDADTKTCPSCNVDLSLFDVGEDIDFDKVKIEDTQSLEDLLDEIAKAEEITSDLVDGLKSLAKEGKPAAKPQEVRPPPIEAFRPQPPPPPKAEEPEPPEPEPVPAPKAEVPMFECPSCGTMIPESSQVCFNCGVEFVQETMMQFECPSCNNLVDADARRCPHCGAIFEEEGVVVPSDKGETEMKPALKEELEAAMQDQGLVEGAPTLVEAEGEQPADTYAELQGLVEACKPLLALAKRYDIDVTASMDLINKAIAAGRSNDMTTALAYVNQSKRQMESVLNSHISSKLNGLNIELKNAMARGLPVNADQEVAYAEKALAAKDYETAVQWYFKAKDKYDAGSGEYGKINSEIEILKSVMKNADLLKMDVTEAENTLSQLRIALDRNDFGNASRLVFSIKEKLQKILPDLIQNEMRNARNLLLNWKAKGVDITKPMAVLKESTVAFKDENYAEALRLLAEFRRETRSL